MHRAVRSQTHVRMHRAYVVHERSHRVMLKLYYVPHQLNQEREVKHSRKTQGTHFPARNSGPRSQALAQNTGNTFPCAQPRTLSLQTTISYKSATSSTRARPGDPLSLALEPSNFICLYANARMSA